MEKRPQTVLIVEDDPGVSALERKRLERAGYAVVIATTAEEALRKLRQTPIDLILLDYRLPGELDGLALFTQVKEAGFDVPVILVTGFSNEATVIKALRIGVRDFVSKSVEYLDYLPEAVGRVLRQVQTEQQLVESEACLAGIIDSAKDAILVAEADQRITLFNRAAEKMFRCPASEALGQPLTRFVPRELTPPPEKGAGPGTQAAESLTYQVRSGRRGIRANGEEFPVETSGSRVQVGGHKFYTVVVRDITERRRAEEALQKEQQFVRAVLDSIQAGVVACDADGILTLFNRAACDLLGQPMAPLPADQWAEVYDLFSPDGKKRMKKEDVPLYRALRGETIRDVEMMVRPKRGRPRALLVSGQAMLDNKGRKLGAVMAMHDITLRKQAEERIREQAAMLEKAQDAISIRDRDDRITFWNRGAERVYGWTAAEVLGQEADRLLSRGPSPELDEARAAFRENGEWQGELRQLSKDGRTVLVDSRWTLVRDPDGQPRAKLVINTDVTERRKLEAQLLHAQRMEGIGRLAGGVAHDFNNLLTVITGYSELLLGQLGPQDPSHDILCEVRKAGDRAAILTRQLLAFSRKQILAPQVLDLNVLVGEMERMLERLIGADIDLATSLDPGLGRVKADPGQLEQVILNLVVNARDAMPRGGYVTLETRNVDLDQAYAQQRVEATPGPYAMLAVTDTGAGIDESIRAKIFDPFFTTKEVGKGTGLGLATVYGIVKQSGGHIDVYTELGRGTSFKIYLPRVEGAVDSKVASVPLRAPTGTETVLLAEDDEGVRSLACLALQSNGYTVLEAREGQEALRLGAHHPGPIHLILTDVIMPRMSGRDLVEQLSVFRPDFKVLFLSGYADDAVLRHGLLPAGSAFLQKPFTPITLARKVREVLDQ